MSDRYSQIVNNPVGGFLAKNVGLPQPVELDRYEPGQPLIDGPVLFGAAPGGRLGKDVSRVLALAEIQRKSHLLFVGDVLVVEDQHRIFVHGGFDLARLIGCERLSQIEAGNLADKMFVKLPDGDRHGVFSRAFERLVPPC
jgi:hypothetical protein